MGENMLSDNKCILVLMSFRGSKELKEIWL